MSLTRISLAAFACAVTIPGGAIASPQQGQDIPATAKAPSPAHTATTQVSKPRAPIYYRAYSAIDAGSPNNAIVPVSKDPRSAPSADMAPSPDDTTQVRIRAPEPEPSPHR